MGRKYNFIYKQLVEDENDIIGHVAYSLYKSAKIRFISDFKKNNGKDPEESDLDNFHSISCMPESIEGYKMKATAILQGFLDDTLSSTAKQIEEDTEKRHEEMLTRIVGRMKPNGFWHGVWQSVVGAVIFMLVMCAILFLLNFSEREYTFTFGGSGSAKIEQSE